MPLLIGLGLESLSISASTIPYAKRIIRNCDFRKAKKMADRCLKYSDEVQIENEIQKFFADNKIIRTRQII
jgi:phosphotransferase system enzyme I (PtsI)